MTKNGENGILGKDLQSVLNELKVMNEKLYEDLQVERRIVFNHNIYGRKYEKALQKYDELAIRYDQMKKVFDVLGVKADEI